MTALQSSDRLKPVIERPDIAASIDKLRDVLGGLKFGSITLTVHDARVVQIDVTEKTRFNG